MNAQRQRPTPGKARPAGEGRGVPAVLVVEDDPLIREALAEALKDAGFFVHEAGGADDATRTLGEKDDVRVVITDVRMPGPMDGVGLARWMRGHAPGVPLILTSGFPMRPDLASINPAIVIVVNKPYTPDEVVGWVSSIVT